ncbi:MAG: isopenicillin N synthase family oxygenase, partial [Deltaproteobacteria bacterium]
RPSAPSRPRLSFPFFFDPGWNARVLPIEGLAVTPAGADSERWDGASVHDFSGTYGDYVLAKIARVFPDLGREVLDRAR